MRRLKGRGGEERKGRVLLSSFSLSSVSTYWSLAVGLDHDDDTLVYAICPLVRAEKRSEKEERARKNDASSSNQLSFLILRG